MINIKNILFSITLLFTLFTHHNIYASDFEVDGISYSITSFDDLTVKVDKVTAEPNACIIIPNHVEYNGRTLTVTSIGSNAINVGGVSLTIPNTIKTIEMNTFHYGLKDLKLEYGPDPIIIQDYYIRVANLYIDREINPYFNFHFSINYYPCSVFIGSNITNLPSIYSEFLTSITIPANITSVSSFDFKSEIFESITCNSLTPPSLKDKNKPLFPNKIYLNAKLIVPQKSLELYKNAEGWKNFFNIETSAIIDAEYVEDADKTSDVFDLTGRPVLKNATPDDINNLDKGIYIVNGKKICIK